MACSLAQAQAEPAGVAGEGVDEPSQAVAEGGVPELEQLLLVRDAPSQDVLGLPLPLRVTQRQRGQLLGAGRPRVP
jgi:hypothetical protein